MVEWKTWTEFFPLTAMFCAKKHRSYMKTWAREYLYEALSKGIPETSDTKSKLQVRAYNTDSGTDLDLKI